EAHYPSIIYDNGQYITVDATGQVATWSSNGEPLAAWRHPNIEAHEGRAQGFRLHIQDERPVFVLIGFDTLYIDTHTYFFNYLEMSVATLPL
ncbi:MAG: hypothetical protein HN348_24660, partial [Proteobacteria bacterium]|nr:hypothetical protein [Pseudomonadota bacterium]